MVDRRVMGTLTDIGTEELGHLEIVATIIRQLTKNLTPEEIKASGFDKYYIDHTLAIWPQAASGEPFSASQFQSTGDTITDLYEDMAAEQKARLTYDNIPVSYTHLLAKVTTEDLREFGMIPEFLGRLPIVFALQAMTEDMLVQILTQPKNAILKQYKKLLALDEVDLKFDDDAVHCIAKKALEKNTGARALRAIIEDFMLDIMYERCV